MNYFEKWYLLICKFKFLPTDLIRTPLVCPKKRHRPEIRQSFGDLDEDDDMTKLNDDPKQSLMPIELLRARWECKEARAESPSAESGAGSSSGSTGSGREVKKRRLDALLSKKFSVTDSPPNSASTAESSSPPPVVSSSTPQQEHGSAKRVNRRKPSSPLSSFAPSAMPPTSTSSILTIRPPSELYAKNMNSPTSRPVSRTKSPRREPHSNGLYLNNIKQEEKDSDKVKGQLMQLQMAQAALLSGAVASNGSGNGLPGFGAAGNPLLYYGYFAQMLQGLQAQQQKLLEQLSSPKSRFHSSPVTSHDKLLMTSPSHGSGFGHLLSANDPNKRHVRF